MAAGDIVGYPQFRLGKMLNTVNIGDRNLADGNFKVAIMKNTWVPATNFNAIQFMDHVSIALATFQVATNVGYTGPITLVNPSCVLNASNLPEFRADDYTVPVDAAGFIDGRYWVGFYDSGLPATSPVVCYGDFGADKSIQTSSLLLDWSNVGDAVNTLLRW